MKHYERVIFLCTGNTYLSPMAEAIYRAKAPKNCPPCISRGLVVLFSEPINPKVNVFLSQHNIAISDHNSKQLSKKDMKKNTLYITMTFSDKVKLLEDYGLKDRQDSVYTLEEFTGENTDIRDPYGKETQDYMNCYDDIARGVEKVIQILCRQEAESPENTKL